MRTTVAPVSDRHALRAAPFVVTVAVSAYSFFTPGPDLPPDVDIWDKLGHALVFAALALTGLLAGVAARRLAVLLFGYAVLTEILQAVLPIQRDGDWHDVLADSIGLAGALILGVAAAHARDRLSRSAVGSTSSDPRRELG
jgi:VanZ family protein